MWTFQERLDTTRRCAIVGLAMIAIWSLVTTVAIAQSKPKASTPAKSTLDIMLMQPSQPKAGDNPFEVMVKGADGKPVSDADVSLTLVMPATKTMAEMRSEVKLKPAGGGVYKGSGQVMMAGMWNVTVSVKQGGKEIGEKKVTVTAK